MLHRNYVIAAPLSTHFRPGTCEEAGCDKYANGWQLRVEGLDDKDLYLATHCGRKYLLVEVAPGERYLVFEAGQPCFASQSHRVRVEREERFLVTGAERREHSSPADWQEDFAEHLDQFHEAYERG